MRPRNTVWMLAACLTGLAPAALAQDEVVITASRIAEPQALGATPVAVLDADELARIGAHHVAETLNRAPGVFINRGNGAEHLTAIRSPVLTGGAGAGSFLYLEDGIPLRAPGFANVNGLFEAIDDLAARVEVVRGPGGAAYGSNALHGLINFISRDPETPEALAELEYGSFGRTRARAFAQGPLDTGAGFIGLSARHEDGWRDDAGLDRVALQARLDGSLGATNWSLRGAAVDLNQETATYIRGFRAFEDKAVARSNPDPEAFRDATALRAALHLHRRLNDLWRVQGAVYGRSNDMTFRLHFLPSEALERTGHDSIGAQSALVREWGEGNRLMLGADAEWSHGYLTENQTLPGFGDFPQGLHYDYEVDALVGAVFAQGRYFLTDALSLEAGARVENTRYDYATNIPAGQEGRFLRPDDRTDEFTTFAPSAGLTWRVSPGVQLFTRAARGVRAPQTAELYRLQPGQQIAGISPEELDSLEGGARLDLWGRGQAEITVFAMRKQNVFFRDADGFNVTDGETRHAGIELDGTFDMTNRLSLAVSGTWADHEYAFDRAVQSSSETIRDGAQVDTAPEWLWNARLVWRPVDKAVIETEWGHVGKYFADAANTAAYDGHDLLNLRASYELGSGWQVFGGLRNLTDERYAERADFAFGSYRYFPGEPRSVFAGVRVRS